MPKNFKQLKVQSLKFKELLDLNFPATQIIKESNLSFSGASLILFVPGSAFPVPGFNNLEL
jgi:hypothetical protein